MEHITSPCHPNLTCVSHSTTCHFKPTPKHHISFCANAKHRMQPSLHFTSHVVLLNAPYAGISLEAETPHVPSLATFAKCQNTWRNYRTCKTTWGLKRAMGNNLFNSATSPTRKLKRTMARTPARRATRLRSLSLSLSRISLTPDAN